MELKALVLAVLEARPMHGYEIVRRARDRGHLRWEEGTVYPLLHKMDHEGLLRSEWKKGPTGKARKYYSLSRRGRTALERARADWREYAAVVSEILLGGRHGHARGSAP
ncbi:MAG: helix-turn-helix transcriptional regulator [Planctomycetes bacterium]|nr:helix-turn-helix transcriptional regulator [Planctomycetota bacterium]